LIKSGRNETQKTRYSHRLLARSLSEYPLRGGWCEMVRCKAHAILRSEAYVQYVAATKGSCNAAEDRFPTAS